MMRQTNALLTKNIILLTRNLRATLLQLIVPIFFMALLFLFQLAVEANESSNSDVKNLEISEPIDIGNIPQCITGLNDTCYTIGYVPSDDDNVVAIIRRLQALNDIPDEQVRGFLTDVEANIFLKNNPNVTQAIYHIFIDYGCDKLPIVEAEACFSEQHPIEEVVGIKYILQYNTTSNYARGRSINPIRYLVLPMLQAITNSALKIFGLESANFDISYLDFTHPQLEPSNIIGTSGPIFIFGSLMFNLVIQTSSVVREKQNHLRESMSVMGLNDFVFWLTWLLTNSVMNIFSSVLLIAAGMCFQFDFFLVNDFLTYFILFILFGLSMVPLAFFLSTLLDEARTATSIGFVLFLVGIMVQSATSLIYAENTDLWVQYLFSLLPFVLFSKGLADLADITATANDVGMRFSQIADADLYYFPIQNVYIGLAIDFVIFLVLTVYLDNVLYHGKSYWFFLEWMCFCSNEKDTETDEPDFKKILKGVDDDVLKEKKLIDKGKIGDNVAVVLKSLQKIYVSKILGLIPDNANAFHAVKGVSLTIEKGQLLCLLGHNGAGKTTTIKMLTGVETVSKGGSSIFGYDVETEMGQIRKVMGVCPQHDILWKQLTAQEHLELFAKIRGIPEEEIAQEVYERLDDVSLLHVKNKEAGGFSGGMQRRLSVAISLIGDPKIVFLDEPTTGMDPVSRRKVWDLIERVKRGRVTLLTTHSMEEADILGDKIAIMKHGYLASLGTSLHLKKKYGSGYEVKIFCKKAKNVKQIKAFVKDFFNGDGVKFTKSDDERVSSFNVHSEYSETLGNFFQELEAEQSSFGIIDFQLNLTTLEDVFLKVAGEEDVKEKVKSVKKPGAKKFLFKLIPFLVLAIAVIILIAGLTIPATVKPDVDRAPQRAAEPEPLTLDSSLLDETLFPFSLQVGSVTSNSMIATLRTLIDGAVDIVIYKGIDSTSWSEVETISNITTQLLHGDTYLAIIEVENLDSDSVYSIVFHPEGTTEFRSHIARFRTALGEDDPYRIIRFGAGSGLGQTKFPWNSLSRAAEQDLDFFIFTGDTIYADSIVFGLQSEFSALYTAAFNNTGLSDLARSTSIYAIWNQHEVGANVLPPGILGPFIAPRYAAAESAFKNAFGINSDETIWRKMNWGTTLDVIFLDTQFEKNTTHIMSDEQYSWFKETLLESESKFKIIVHSMPISYLGGVSAGIEGELGFFSWAAYAEQREEIISFINDNEIPGVMWLSGGIEMSVLTSNISALTNETEILSYQFEMVSGPVGTQINSAVRFSSIRLSGSLEMTATTWSYTLFECDPVLEQINITIIDNSGFEVETLSLLLDDINLGFEESGGSVFLGF